ncbi:PspC domain-containing protein [Leucobacter sp. UT-8R-CII-1-4]|uniref:PspC domain-containing protein n=1 Tax=Leucobacter sp. UT-8R-CII-1-4 TaxID=3040075 RepID=UPI0024A9A87E|nr:PspC domain-containing protein [Leucobacter sp. UT-8R-CII-1-4]MDI6023929.1 PspC domain-containing protein [Leucobacter sp. UT-8R-CII-1-4]
MNDTTPPQGGPQGNNGPSFERGSDRFFTWLRGLDITRSGDRWIAGVAGGIAAKAKIDPIIVRGVFIVLALLGGPGILLYIAAWLMLPDASGRIHLEELFRGRASAGAVVAAIVLGAVLIVPTIIVFFRTVFLGPWGWDTWGVLPTWLQVTFGVLWWAVAVPALAIWLITWLSSRSRNHSSGHYKEQANKFADQANEFAERTTTQANDFAERTAAQANDFAERTSKKANEWGQSFSEKADEWGTKVDEKSKDWEKWGHEYRDAHRLGAVHVVVSLALALLAAGCIATATLAYGGDNNLALTTGLLAGVTVLAISTIIAGIRGRDSGFIGFLSFFGVVALIFAPFSSLLPSDTEVVPFGDSALRVQTVGEDQALVTIAGNSLIDLSDVRASANARTVDLWILGGNATVRMPDSAATTVRVDLFAGTIKDQRDSADERRQGGVLMSRTMKQGSTQDEQIQVHVRMLGGTVIVEGADAPPTKPELTRAEKDRQKEIDKLKDRISELEDAR